MLYNVLLIVLIIVSIAIIALVLMQHGKGADAGAAFGSGASGTVFGSSGSGNFLSRMTGILATVFFLTSLALAWLVSDRNTTASDSIVDTVETTELPAAAAEVPTLPGEAPAVSAGDAAATADAVKEAAQSEVPELPSATSTDAGADAGDAAKANE